MNDHRDILVWHDAVDLAQFIYEITRLYPEQEQQGIVSQMRKSVVSLAGHIAAGSARASTAEFIDLLQRAIGSAAELDTQIEISIRLELANVAILENLQEKTNNIATKIQELIDNLD